MKFRIKKTVAILLSLFVLMIIVLSCDLSVKKEQVTNNNVITTSIENNELKNIENTNEISQNKKNHLSVIDNKTIDPIVYLDYKKGIEEKVYKWIKSDDDKYFTLAYIDENGNPVKNKESNINVGANNIEKIDNGNDKNKKTIENQQHKDFKNNISDGNMPGGFRDMLMKNKDVLRGVYINANITNIDNQTMLVYAPAEYFNVDEYGNVDSINYENVKNGYTAKTAPIIFLNECGGWRSSSPRSCDMSYIDEGFIYVTCGARSRDAMNSDGTIHTGKSPMQMADLKSGVISLRYNDSVIPGDKNKIVSIGTSGGGQMSSILGVSGDMKEYYPYMYDAGAIGVKKNTDGTYESLISDSIFAAQNYCPIADIENADLAYAWWWVDLVDDGGIYNGNITNFEKRLQELEAEEFINYLNSLQLKDEKGNDLTLTSIRSGTYYNAILNNLSDALNKFVDAGEIDVENSYKDYTSWLTKDENNKYKIIDLKQFMIGTGLVNNRNKSIPGFDSKDKSAENNAFGKDNVDAVHFSKSIANIIKNNYDELSKLDGFNKEQIDEYIEDTILGEDADLINSQTALLNATHILLGIDGLKPVNPVKHFRNRSGTADQHTSFSIGYNILLAAAMYGIDVDYSLVWNMGHGNNEGTSTGTFISWVNKISK